jgi:hypothetical protein
MQVRLQEFGLAKLLWQQQKGVCPACGQLIEEDDRWAIEPATPLESGGPRQPADLGMLHSACRRSFLAAMSSNQEPAPPQERA